MTRKDQTLEQFIQIIEEVTERAGLKDDELTEHEQKGLFFLVTMYKKDKTFRAFTDANTEVFARVQRDPLAVAALLTMTLEVLDILEGRK